nr:putative retrotransposon polyprotein [Ipomoea batatas]
MLPRRFVEERVDNNLSSLRMEMPTFNGDDEPEVFLNWVDEVEDIFGLHNFGEEKKFKTAIASLKDFAKLWWKQLSRRRLEDQDEPIETWGELKREMRRKFVPSNFYRDMRRKLQELKQGSKSVREFYKEMERLKARANIQEDDETTIARILEGFNRDIRRELRNQEFDDVDKLVRVASKVEDELRSERGSKPSVSSQWDQPRRATNNSYQSRTQKEYSRPSHTQEEKKNNQREKEKFQEGSKQKVSTVTCYRCQGRGHYARECPNTKKILTTGKDEREYMSANESDDEELEPIEERQKDDHSEEEVQEDDALHFNCVVHKALSTLVVLDKEEQREKMQDSRVDAVLSLSSIYDPESEREHDCNSHNYESDINPLAVAPQARAVCFVYFVESNSDEIAVLQIDQELTVMVQPEAHVHRGGHLAVDFRSQTPCCYAYVARRARRDLAYTGTPHLRFVKIITFSGIAALRSEKMKE